MDLETVNEDANFIVQLYVDNKYQTLTEEYSASSAIILATNARILTNLNVRVLSKRSNNKIIAEFSNS